MPGTALQHAQNFGQGREVQDALAGRNPAYADSVYYRYQIEKDPAAKAYLGGLVDRLKASNISPDNPGKTQDWQGKSHNFFVQNPWAAPVAQIGASLIPRCGPLAPAGFGSVICSSTTGGSRVRTA